MLAGNVEVLVTVSSASGAAPVVVEPGVTDGVPPPGVVPVAVAVFATAVAGSAAAAILSMSVWLSS